MKNSSSNTSMHGIVAMLIAVLLFSMMDAGLKWLSPHYSAVQITAMRALASLPFVIIYVLLRGTVASLIRIRWHLHVFRAALGIAMLVLFTYGIKTLPLSEAYALFFIAPLFITALSVPLLKEKVGAARWLAIFVGLIGVLIVLRPGASNLASLGSLAILAAAACYAISAITVRVLSKTDSSDSMVFWAMAMIAIGAGSYAAPNWQPLMDMHWPILVGIGVTGFFGQVAVTAAFQKGEASVIAPFEYSALAWGMGLDWLLWKTLPDSIALLGAGVIISSGLYLIRKEKAHTEKVHAEVEHP
jgi:drug/metabolite transporter (DMT)-like permease